MCDWLYERGKKKNKNPSSLHKTFRGMAEEVSIFRVRSDKHIHKFPAPVATANMKQFRYFSQPNCAGKRTERGPSCCCDDPGTVSRCSAETNALLASASPTIISGTGKISLNWYEY